MVAVSLPRLLASLEVSDSEDTGALIVLDCHQRGLCDLNLFCYSDSRAAVINILAMFIPLHLTYEERTVAIAVKS